jgi:hypothetical protein
VQVVFVAGWEAVEVGGNALGAVCGSGDPANEEILDPVAIQDRKDAIKVERLGFAVAQGSRVRPSWRATSTSSRKASNAALDLNLDSHSLRRRRSDAGKAAPSTEEIAARDGAAKAGWMTMTSPAVGTVATPPGKSPRRGALSASRMQLFAAKIRSSNDVPWPRGEAGGRCRVQAQPNARFGAAV